MTVAKTRIARRPRLLPPDPIRDVRRDERDPRAVAAEFDRLLADGFRLRPAGEARHDPEILRTGHYRPRYAVRLYRTTYYLTRFLFEEGLNFLVAHVVPSSEAQHGPRGVYPRIFYKDSSLVWRVASHMIRQGDEDWIGKGDVRVDSDADGEFWVSDEDTTNLPYEIQGALDRLSREQPPLRDDAAVGLVLRNAPAGRLHPYRDFSQPRRRAVEAQPIHGDRPVARITRKNDPGSLRFAAGFEPDFEGGRVEVNETASRLYGGAIRKYRILSRNRIVQYQFVASPTHVWINPPQALTSEITSYGVRALHVRADDEIFCPGYEYHIVDDSQDPPEVVTQIPEGWAGDPSAIDPERADASPWIEALPVIREFRRMVVGSRPRKRSGAIAADEEAGCSTSSTE